MPRLPRNPKFWLAGFLVWFLVLWTVSSFKIPGDFNAPVKHFDKVQHFTYFLIGSGLLSAWLFRRNPDQPNWKANIITTIIILSLIGGLDEYHQSFTPGRSGNDPFDWLADLFGAMAGAFIFMRIHHPLK